MWKRNSFEVKPCYPLEWSDESIDLITVVKIYSKKELEEIFYNCGFKTVHIYRKGKGVFLKAKN